jgi:hypothetical protein
MRVSIIIKNGIGSFATAKWPLRPGEDEGTKTMTAQALVRGFYKFALPLFNALVLGGVSLLAATMLAAS